MLAIKIFLTTAGNTLQIWTNSVSRVLMERVHIVVAVASGIVTTVTVAGISFFHSNKTLESQWKILSSVPFVGKWIFSTMVGLVSPYSGSIRPSIQHVSDTKAVIKMSERRSLRNPFNSLHLAALINLGELTTAMCIVHQCRNSKQRAIPVEVSAKFHSKARGVMTATAICNRIEFKTEGREYTVDANIFDEKEKLVAVVSVTWKASLTSNKSKAE